MEQSVALTIYIFATIAFYFLYRYSDSFGCALGALGYVGASWAFADSFGFWPNLYGFIFTEFAIVSSMILIFFRSKINGQKTGQQRRQT